MFFFCKQKTAYEMRISDWSSDVCSSDLQPARADPVGAALVLLHLLEGEADRLAELLLAHAAQRPPQPHPAADMNIDRIGPAFPAVLRRHAVSRHPHSYLVMKGKRLNSWRSEEHKSELQSLMRTWTA